MPRRFRIGDAIYGTFMETKPTRGPVFIGSATDDIARLEGIVHCCFDFRKIFFALVYHAEIYDKVPDTIFERITDHYRFFPEKIPGEIFNEHLAAQLAPRSELLSKRNNVVQLPSCVIYTGRIDNSINSPKATDLEFIEIFCDFYGISRLRLP